MILCNFCHQQDKQKNVDVRGLQYLKGFIQRDIKYDWNQLYVLGLHHKTSSDGLKNYIQLISGYEASVLWFKPNGKAIVTMKTDRIKGKHHIRIKVNCSVNQKLGKFGEIQTP